MIKMMLKWMTMVVVKCQIMPNAGHGLDGVRYVSSFQRVCRTKPLTDGSGRGGSMFQWNTGSFKGCVMSITLIYYSYSVNNLDLFQNNNKRPTWYYYCLKSFFVCLIVDDIHVSFYVPVSFENSMFKTSLRHCTRFSLPSLFFRTKIFKSVYILILNTSKLCSF